MADRSKEFMRVDRRLLERPGWISNSDLARELEALPDVSDKIDPGEDEPAGEAPDTSAGPTDVLSGSSSPQTISTEEASPIPAFGNMPSSDRDPGESGGGFSPST